MDFFAVGLERLAFGAIELSLAGGETKTTWTDDGIKGQGILAKELQHATWLDGFRTEIVADDLS